MCAIDLHFAGTSCKDLPSVSVLAVVKPISERPFLLPTTALALAGTVDCSSWNENLSTSCQHTALKSDWMKKMCANE